MHHHGNPTRNEQRDVPDNRSDDARTQRAVLAIVLAEHPMQMTIAELTRELTGEQGDFAQSDAVLRAVAELGAVGLIHRSGEFVLPSRAATCFADLEQDR
jgi:hypothetical protein